MLGSWLGIKAHEDRRRKLCEGLMLFFLRRLAAQRREAYPTQLVRFRAINLTVLMVDIEIIAEFG